MRDHDKPYQNGQPDPQYTALHPHPSCKVYAPPRDRISGLTEGQRKAMTRPLLDSKRRPVGVMNRQMAGGPVPLGILGTISVSRHLSPVVETRQSQIPGMRSTPKELVRPGSRRGRGRKMDLHEDNLCHRMGVLPVRWTVASQLKAREKARHKAWLDKRTSQLYAIFNRRLRVSVAQALTWYHGLRKAEPAIAAHIDRQCGGHFTLLAQSSTHN